jgi:hypothetical protein
VIAEGLALPACVLAVIDLPALRLLDLLGEPV